LCCGEFADREVVEDQHGGAGQFGQALVPAVVGVSAGEGGQHSAGFGEPHVGAVPDCKVSEGLGDVAFADTDRPVEDHRLARGQPVQRREVTDLPGGELGAGREVEAFQGGLLLELGAADPAGDGVAVAAGDLVVAEHLEELDVAEFPGSGLGEAGFEGLEHPGQLQGPQGLVQGGLHDHADTSASEAVSGSSVVGRATTLPNSRSGPCRNAAAPPSPVAGGGGSASAPAKRMPLTVR
jgi:hypothetical protein